MKKNTIINVITLLVTSFLLVFVIMAWYVTNAEAKASGAMGLAGSEKGVNYLDTVTAVRHSLSGSTTTNVYEKQNDGKLLLKTSTLQKPGENPESITVSPNTYFMIPDLLPDEYVDITIGFRINGSESTRRYDIDLRNISGEAFDKKVDGYTHYVTGVYKYKSISLKDKNGNDVAGINTNDNDYKWFNSYNPKQDDSATYDAHLLSNATWNSSYESLHYTFRIYEDFSQYNELINQADGYYGNLLSEKQFFIGEIYIFLR